MLLKLCNCPNETLFHFVGKFKAFPIVHLFCRKNLGNLMYGSPDCCSTLQCMTKRTLKTQEKQEDCFPQAQSLTTE